jgi:ELWxxDGT repeat protein
MRLFFTSIFLLLAINISAQSCPAGSYGSTSCTLCPSGIYTTGSATGSISVSACTICAPGYAGTVTNSGTSSASGCSICSAGSYSAAGASTCYSCNMGSYSSTGASMCTPCPLGFYTTGFGSTSVSQCSVCARGYAGTGLSLPQPSDYTLLGCTICPPGKYSWNNAALCTSCPVGIYTADSGSVSVGFCSICAPGYAGIIDYAGTTRATGCSICAAGSYAPAGPSGETSCATCPAGTFSSAAGSPVCESCPVGSYSSTGATSCSLCPTGIYTTNSATESTSISACTICAPGYAGTVTNSGTLNAAGCSICPPGSYASAGSTSCTSCPTGVYTTGSSSGNTSIVACTICAPGFAGLITFPGTLFVSGCSRCVAGSYSFAGATSCTTCHSGSYSNSGATSCTLCPSGIFTTGSATGSISVSACTICAPGYAGTVTNSGTLNAAGCVICSSGSYSSAGSLTCQFCATNTYSYSGASSCSSCLPGSTFISSSLGCRPSSATSSSPIDTSFYLSGSQIEGLAAFSNIINSNGLTHYSSSTSYPYEALVVSFGSYVSTPLLSSLPTGSSAFTVSSWVKCDASSLTDSNPSGVVVSWGSSQSSTSTSLTAATLAVTYAGRLSSPIVTVSTIAGGSSRGFVDGTNARFNYANGIAVDAANNVYVADSSNYVIRKITSSGFVSTFSGSGIQGLLDGTRTLARFSNINGIAVDANENIYVTESHSIRKINASGFVTTLSGGLSLGKLDGTGTNAQFYLPYGVAVDINGTVYVADTSNHLIRKITSSGNVTTVAGSRRGFADGAGTEAKFDVPTGVTVDISGNLYIADSNSPRIRKISSSGAVTTIAGNGRYEFADGIGTNAMFKYPYGITIDATGNIYVTDQSIFRIRKITLAGVVTTLAGSGLEGFQDGAGQNAKFKYFLGISADISGNIYVGDVERVRKLSLSPTLPGPLSVCDSTWHHIALTYSGSASTNTLTAYVDGSIMSSTSATFAISSSSSSTLRIGWNGNSIDKELFSGSISDIRVFSRSMTCNEIVTLSQPLLSSGMEAVNPSPIRSSTSYTWYCSSGLYGPNITLTRSTSDGSWLTSGTVNCQLCDVNTFSYGSSSCSTCPSGSTFISSSLGCRPSSSTSAGPIDTSFYFSGSQLEGLSAFTNITSPSGITYTSDAFGVANAAISLSSGSYLSIPGSSSPSTLPSGGKIEWTVSAWVKCPAPNSWASVIEWGEVGKGWNSLRKSASIVLGGVREPVKSGSIFGGFYQPNDLHVDTFGNIYVADKENNAIKKISVDGTVYSVISSGLLQPVGLVMDKDGNFYVTNNDGVKKIFSNGTILTLLLDSATGVYFRGISIDKEGNVYVTHMTSSAIKKIHTNGTISLIGSGFTLPHDVFVDEFGSVFVADTGNKAIKKVFPNGTIVNLLDSGLNSPQGIYVDVFGTVWVLDVDYENNSIKTIALDGTVSLISIDGLFGPSRIHVDLSGNLYIADTFSNSIKVFIYYSFLPVCDCTWHHVSLSYSPTSSLLSSYIDGVLDSQNKNIKVTLPSPSFSNLRIGWNGNTSENFGNLRTLSISDLRIYNRTLSLSEIVTLSQPFLPTYSNVVNPTPVAGSSSYSWSCLAGWYGPIQTLNRNWSSGSWLSSGTVNCQVCGANTFSYGGSSCSTCPSGSTFISSSLGCRPSSSTSAGPIDTSFYFSGSQLEGLSAFTNITSPSGITYTSDAFGVANAAISLSSGSYLSIPGSSSPSTLPSGGKIEWTVSAWVKCPAQSSLASSVIEWGDFERGWASTDGNVALLVGGTGGLASLGMIGGLLKSPQGIFLDSEDNIYIADTHNNAIKKLSSRGIISTILDTGLSSPSGVVVNADGTVFITDTGNNCIKMISKDGIVSTFASVLNGPTGITIDSSGSVYFADTYAGSIKVIYPNMTLATIFTKQWTYSYSVVVDNSNNVYALLNQEVIKLNTVSGVATTLLNGLYSPRGLAIDTFGTLYIVETFKNLVYKITSNGMVTTIKLKGVNLPYGIAVDSVGNLLLSDTSNHAIKKFSPTGSETVLLHSFVNSLNSVAVDDSGNVYVTDYIYELDINSNIHSIKKIKPSGQVITIPDIKLNQPSGITVDKSGNVFVADRGNYVIKKISLSGIVSTIKRTFFLTNGLAIDGSGNLYVLNNDVLVKMFPNGTESRSLSIGGGGAPGFSVDVNGNVYLSDLGSTIRKLSSTDWSSVTILTDSIYRPEGLVVDLYGNVFVADTHNHAIKKITPSGTITSIVTSGLTNPRGVAVDSSGSILYVVDSFNPAIKSYTLNSYVPICDSTWHHISLSYAPSLSLLSAYVDGTLVSQRSSNVTLPSPSLSSLRVGWNGKANRNNGNIYSGTISDLRIYNRTLSSSEIVTLSQPFLPTYSDAVNPTPIANSSSYLWSCIAGSNNGPTLTLARSSFDGSWSFSGSINCPSPTASATTSPSSTSSKSAEASSSTSSSVTGTISASQSSIPTWSSTSSRSGSMSSLPTFSRSTSSSPTSTRSTTASASSTRSSSSTGTPSVTITTSSSPSVTRTSTSSPSATRSGSVTVSTTQSSSSTGTPSRSGSTTSSPSVTRTSTSSPSATRSGSVTVSTTQSSSSTGTPSRSGSTTSSPSVTRTSTSSPSATRSGSVTVSTTQSSSSTGTPSRSGSTTSSPSVTRTSTSSPSATRSGSVTVSTTQSSLSTGTPSRSGSTTSSPSVTRTSTSSPSATRSGSVTATSSRSGSTSSSPSVTRSTTLTSSVTSTGSATPSATHSDSSSLSPSVTITTSSSLSVTRTSTSSPSATQSVTVTSSSTRSSSVTRSSSASPTSSRLSSISMSSTPTSTITTSATSTSSSSPTATISTSSTPIYSLTTEGPVMLLDINPGSYDSNPGLFTVFNNKLYFQARGIDTGIELWSSDGTSDGTFLLKDIYSGSGSGFPSFFTVFNNKLYFAAQDTSSGFELWSTDGTALGTTIVKDIWSGSSSSWPTYLTVLNEKLYFWANDGISGTELFSYDGTSDISIVKDIFPGSSMNNPLAVFNNKLYFAARDTSSGYELWCSDGTDSGTLMVKDIWSGSSSSNPSGFTVFNNKLFFQAAVSASGVELYSSDGTDSGTIMVKDIWSGSSSSNPSGFTVFNNKLFFQAAVSASGVELYSSDGTDSGTIMVKDIWSGSSSSNPSGFIVFNDKLFFQAAVSASGVELYSSDGTDSGTIMVKDIWSGSSSSNPSGFIVFNDKLFFQAAVSASGVELYSSDGTDSGTIMVKDIWSGSSSSNPSGFIVFNDKLFFKATDGYNGNELWVLSTLLISSSTSSGTATITPTATSTSSSSPTATISTSVTPTETTINISIISNIATNTPSSTSSGTATITPTATSTSSSSPTATISNSVTSTETTINISIISNIATNTPSSTSSGTATITPTISTLASISSAVSLTSSRTPFSSPSSTISSSDSAISTASTSASKSAAGTNVTLTSSATSSATATSTAVTISICSPGSFLQSSSSQCIPCAVNTYSYSGASSCSTCPSGSTFISSSLGCRPSSSTSAGPIDTSFYLSGSQTEGLSAFSNIINSNGFTYYTSSTTFPSTALVISSGSYLSTPLLSSLPIDSSAFSLSSWVKCDASSLTDSNPSGVVVSWGSVGESSTSTNLTAVTLAVTSTFRNRGVSTVSTIAGTSTQGFFDAVGTLSTFFNPSGLAIDVSSGSLYIADSNNRRIRKITSTGDATTIAGSGVAGYLDGIGTNARFSNPQGVAFDPSSSIVYVADTNNNRIRVITLSTGVVTTLAGSGQQGFADGLGISAVFSRPYGIAVDKTSGNIFICDRNNHRIRKITPNGLVSTLAGGLFASFADGTGSNAKFNYPQGIVLDASDENLYVTDSDNQRIRKVSTLTGIVKTIAGSGSAGDSDGLGTDATFRSPSGITLDKVGNLYVTDSNNLVRKIDVLTGMVTSIAGISGVADFADGSSTTAMFNNPQGIVVSSTGKDIYLTDTNNHRIRLITTIPNLPGPLPVCDSTWHNIALSYYTTISTAIRRLVNSSGGSSSGALTAYIDGINFASIPATYSISSSSSSSTFRIGSNGLSNGELFSGSLSDLRIYNRPLSENELKSLSTRPSSFPIPNTINNNYESTSSSSSVFIIIGAIVGVVVLSGGGFGYYYNQRRKLLKKEKEEEEEISLKVVKIDSSSKEKDGDVRVNVDDTPNTSTNNWYSTPQIMTSTPLSNISSTSISLASSRVTAYEEKNESTTGMTSPESNNSFLKSSSENLQSSESQKKNNKTNSTTKSPTSDEDVDDDLILATKREFPEDDDDDDDDAILPGRIKDGESEELNLTGLMSAVEGTAVGEAAGSLLTTASSALEGLALASVSIPLVGLALKGLSMVCNQVEAFSRSNLEAEKLLGRLTRLQTVVQKAATDIDFCNEHSGIFDYMVKTLNKAANKLEVISKRSKLGKFVFAQSDLDIMERVDRAIMMHLTELQAAMQAQTLNMVKALHDGMLERSNKEDEIKAPPLPPFSMRFKQSDIIFDPPLEKQLVNAPRGSFGVVVFGIWKAHNLPCAVKMISSRTATGVVAVSMMSWLSEAELMRRLREHLNSVTRQTPQNICTLFGIGAVESPKTGEVTQYMVVMERLEGSLRDKLDSYLKKKRHPPLIQALTWIRDVAMGISECHDANVVHSDLKAANALLSKKNEAKLCDLGAGRVTRDMTATSSMINSTGGGIIRGSLPWLSSELLDDQSLQPSKASDVYAWACVCWEILSCRIPYHDEEGVLAIDLNKLKNLSAIVNGKLRPDLSVLRADAPSSIVEMMKRAWDPEPRDRPQIGEILETLESALSSFKDAKKGNSRRAAEAAAADLRSSALLTQASKAEEEDAKKAGEDLKALTKSLEEARALRIATIKKRHDEAALQMRIDLEAEEKKLEEEARREMALEIEKNETMLAQRKAKWIGEVNEKKEERLRNAHLLDEKDRARIVAEFEVENRDVEKRIEAARIEQTSRLETRLKERKEAKAKAAQKALLKLDDEAEIAVEEEKNKDVHDFLLD